MQFIFWFVAFGTIILGRNLKNSTSRCKYQRLLFRKPNSFLIKYCPEQFKILGITKTWYGIASKIYPEQIQIDHHGKESKVTKLNDGAVLLHSKVPQNETYYIVDGKYYTQVYARVLIRHIRL